MPAKLFAALLFAIPAAGVASPAKPDISQEAKTFLLRYTGLTSTSDVAALNLYRDDARVQVWSWQGGKAQSGQVSGKDWKKQLRVGWFDGTTKLEASSFEGARVTQNGKRLVIQARRYSQTRCYWDSGYTVAIEPDDIGQYQIVEERISFERDSTCSSESNAAASIVVSQTAGSMPIAIPAGHALPSTNPAGVVAASPPKLPPNIVPRGQMPRIPPPSTNVAGHAGRSNPPPK